MKKTLLWVLSLIAVSIVAFYVFIYPKLEIVSGYNAKILCSCLFVSGMDQAQAERVDLGYSLLWLASNEVDLDDQSVRSSVLGIHAKTAIHRNGLGCTLLNDATIPTVIDHTIDLNSLEYGDDIWDTHVVKGTVKMEAALQKAFDSGDKRVMNTRAILAVKNGKIVGEAYAEGITMDMPLLGWSMTKSITSMLAGILVQDGFWSLNEPMPMSEWKGDERAGITLKNMLQMSSGLTWTEDYGKDSKITVMLYTVDSMGAFAGHVPLQDIPGEVWKYSSGTTNILAAAMAQAFDTRQEYWLYPYKSLFAPLGMKSFVMETDASGHFVGSSYSYGTARDWAKLGLLYLNHGNWNGAQILDSTWVDFSLMEAEASEGKYGGHFWLNRSKTFSKYGEDAFWMGGYQGQQVSIHPQDSIVVVRLGVTYQRGDFDFDDIIGGIVEAAKEDH